jgi:hypothetical protein
MYKHFSGVSTGEQTVNTCHFQFWKDGKSIEIASLSKITRPIARVYESLNLQWKLANLHLSKQYQNVGLLFDWGGI